MIERQAISDLRGEIAHTLLALAASTADYDRFKREEYSQLGRRRLTAVYIADSLDTFYTCLETLFFRIAETFGNTLGRERWHKDLLDRMRIETPEVRPAVITDTQHRDLQELLRFRHFNRYYCERDYDWDKLDFLEAKYLSTREVMPDRLAAFDGFLSKLLEELKRL